MNSTNQHPDRRIDDILHALAITEAPSDLAQRISARLAQRPVSASTRTSGLSLRRLMPALDFSSASGGMYPFAVVATLLLVSAGWIFSTTHPRQQQVAAQPSRSRPASGTPSLISPTAPQRATVIPTRQPSYALATQATTITPQDISDATALEETLAPSHPAPPLPLTSQEALLLRSTRPGQPIEVAELDTLRESALSHLATLREQATLRQYVHSLLGPLEAAQALTPSSQPEDQTPVPNPEPPPSK